MRSGFRYTTGRICAVAAKPLWLFAANNFFSPTTAQGLAVTFLASALALIGIGAGPYRRFYPRYFAQSPKYNGVTLYLYVVSVLILAVLGCVIVCALTTYFSHSYVLGAVTIVFFASEKLADEVLRFRLFERNLAAWGSASMARAILQFLGIACILIFDGRFVPAWPLVFALAGANFAVFVPQVSRRLWAIARPDRWRILIWLGKRAARWLLRNRMLWAIALLGSTIAYLDRLIAVVLDKQILPIFSLVVMCFSVIQMAVDFFFLSRHRRDFLERRMSIAGIASSGEFVRILGGALAIGCLACVVALSFSKNGATFPVGYIAAIAVLQLCIGIAAVPIEMVYWTHKLHRILEIEIGFWILFGAAAILVRAFDLGVMGMLSLAVVCVLSRLSLYIATAMRLSKNVLPSTYPIG